MDSYRYGGLDYDRSAEMAQIIAGLPGLEQVIHVPGPAGQAIPSARAWDELMDHPPVPASEFEFEQVPFGHPLWVLFSSGTTGLPKAITHSHGGILIEQLKLQTLNMDLRPGDRLFFYTTSGWMMWNFLVSSLLLGVTAAAVRRQPGLPRSRRAVGDGAERGGDDVRREPRLRRHAVEGGRGARRESTTCPRWPPSCWPARRCRPR